MLKLKYLYNNTAVANKLHQVYRGTYSEMLSKHLDDGHYQQDFDQLCGMFANADRLQLKYALIKWVRVFDPNMLHCSYNADESHGKITTYKQIQDVWQLPKPAQEIVLGLTFSGQMQRCIEYAKQNKTLANPSDLFSSYIEKFTKPTSDWFHLQFTKDLAKICHPNWLKCTLSNTQEQQDLLSIWLKKHRGQVPNQRDVWVVPKGHPLEIYAKLNFKILPSPGKVWKKFGSLNQAISMMLVDVKQGIKPARWDQFKYNNPIEAEKLEQQYPEILTKSKWLKENLTPSQQEKVDKWNKVADLVLNDVDDYTLMKNMNTEDRSLVGNHLKMLDKKMRFDSTKVKNLIFPIIEKIKTHRPTLYKLYCHTKLDTKANTLDDWLRDIEARRTQDEYIAMKDKSWEDLTQEQRYQISAFVRKGSRYPDFAKRIKKLRPDWFDAKRRKQIIRMRFHAKEKVAI